MNRDIEQTLVALFAEDLGLARVHGNHAVSMPLEVVADEVARAQLGLRQPDDGDGLRVVQDALDDQRILKRGEIECRAHRDATSLSAEAAARAKPCSRSQIRSSTDSVLSDRRIVPGPTPAALSSSSFSWRCVVLAGWMMRLFESPTLARCDHNVTPRMKSCPAPRPPRQSKENTAPAPRGRYLSTRGR